MAKVLQLRRGTTAKNNNFTGLPGEVSFDTELKTLRVHDGETPGGFQMARRDEIGSGENNNGGETGESFDINTVPDEFWQDIVNRFAGEKLQINVSKRLMSLSNPIGMHFGPDDKTKPIKFATAELVCQTDEAGYHTGDIVAAFGIGSRTNPLPNLINNPQDINSPYLEFYVGGEAFWVSHNDTGVKTPITNANWKIQFKVWQ